MPITFFILIIGVPLGLSVWNITTLILFLKNQTDKPKYKIIEAIAILVGALYFCLMSSLSFDFVDWNVAVIAGEMHTPINTHRILTIVVFAVIGLIGYCIVRWIPLSKQPPLLSAIGIAGMYAGIIVYVLWCVQMPPLSEYVYSLFFILYPANLILLYIKTIAIVSLSKNSELQSSESQTKFKRISMLLNKSANLPWIALIVLIPLMGITVLILILFGQEPDSIIKAWTETADWTLSQKVAPADIPYDGHYLCTVAATGHRKIVKPQRTGIRHDHKVLVNRQLCIANAFEEILHEKTPHFHKAVRSFYDKTGFPISKYIRTKFTADIVYFIMKPLEWFFLMVIYAVDVKPENRIAVQYPHSAPPQL